MTDDTPEDVGLGETGIDTSPALETMFQGKSAAEWRRLYRGAYDWGPDLGREIIEE
jgi:hypothetical protein